MDRLLTQCPQCATLFKVSANQLHLGKGQVRCGSCLHVFDAQNAIIETSKNDSSNQQEFLVAGEVEVNEELSSQPPSNLISGIEFGKNNKKNTVESNSQSTKMVVNEKKATIKREDSNDSELFELGSTETLDTPTAHYTSSSQRIDTANIDDFETSESDSATEADFDLTSLDSELDAIFDGDLDNLDFDSDALLESQLSEAEAQLLNTPLDQLTDIASEASELLEIEDFDLDDDFEDSELDDSLDFDNLFSDEKPSSGLNETSKDSVASEEPPEFSLETDNVLDEMLETEQEKDAITEGPLSLDSQKDTVSSVEDALQSSVNEEKSSTSRSFSGSFSIDAFAFPSESEVLSESSEQSIGADNAFLSDRLSDDLEVEIDSTLDEFDALNEALEPEPEPELEPEPEPRVDLDTNVLLESFDSESDYSLNIVETAFDEILTDEAEVSLDSSIGNSDVNVTDENGQVEESSAQQPSLDIVELNEQADEIADDLDAIFDEVDVEEVLDDADLFAVESDNSIEMQSVLNQSESSSDELVPIEVVEDGGDFNFHEELEPTKLLEQSVDEEGFDLVETEISHVEFNKVDDLEKVLPAEDLFEQDLTLDEVELGDIKPAHQDTELCHQQEEFDLENQIDGQQFDSDNASQAGNSLLDFPLNSIDDSAELHSDEAEDLKHQEAEIIADFITAESERDLEQNVMDAMDESDIDLDEFDAKDIEPSEFLLDTADADHETLFDKYAEEVEQVVVSEKPDITKNLYHIETRSKKSLNTNDTGDAVHLEENSEQENQESSEEIESLNLRALDEVETGRLPWQEQEAREQVKDDNTFDAILKKNEPIYDALAIGDIRLGQGEEAQIQDDMFGINESDVGLSSTFDINEQLIEVEDYSNVKRLLWFFGSLLLIFTLLLQYVWFYRADLQYDKFWQPMVEAVCDVLPCDLAPKKDVSKIKINHRLLKPVSRSPQKMSVDLMLVNNANFEQPYPSIQVEFTDHNGNTLSNALILPSQYLTAKRQLTLMPKAVDIHVHFEIDKPQHEVSGYTFSFQ